jgi:hypothetical protein
MVSFAVATFNLDFGLFLRLKLKFIHSVRNAHGSPAEFSGGLDDRCAGKEELRGDRPV